MSLWCVMILLVYPPDTIDLVFAFDEFFAGSQNAQNDLAQITGDTSQNTSSEAHKETDKKTIETPSVSESNSDLAKKRTLGDIFHLISLRICRTFNSLRIPDDSYDRKLLYQTK
ncbi:hypothetical protein QIU19_06755 [Capnocytophaga canimorsus]|nr:hypothetical protein [Capnocytophaga canimorsus]WGU69572.1 hypothetical protein QIU19_06755 [Capnocytophaga canimorsus]